MADGFLSGLVRRAYDARETAEDYGRDAGRRLSEARETAEDYGRDAGRRLRGGGSDTRGELRRLWSQMEDLVERNLGSSPSEAARAAGDYARDYARDGRELAHDVADQVRSVTRERPFVAIGIAVAATLIITSLLSSSKRR
jgi:ElaB/YqjD/DUF883 family membrane-anchored ribosome-binding protein